VGKRRCAACGSGRLRAATERLSVTLPRCGLVASIAAPARRCAGCGEVLVERDVLERAHLSIGCELADRGVHTGDALRHMRKALELRAADLARLLGVTPETVSHWETGRAPPARAAFVAVAAMVEEAIAGRTTTRDRLRALAIRIRLPRVLRVRLRAASRR
jgi:putative zinc finger/helix-turn-helix YgiT family protein